MSKTFDLSKLNLSAGAYEITVKARASGYEDSPASNAVSYVVAGEETYTVSGTYRWNNPITEVNISQSLSFISDGIVFKYIKTAHGLLSYQKMDGTWVAVAQMGIDNEYFFIDGAYRTITFDGVQTVSKEFYDCLTSNAVQQTITFTVDGTQYTALSDMTWGEWVESEYNTGGYIWNANGIICNADDTQSVYYGESPMSRGDVIVSGRSYIHGAYNLGIGGGGN